MQTSILLAKIFGVYLVILPLAYFLNKNLLGSLISLFKNKASLFISGVVALFIGIIIVLNHNIWTQDWRVIITIFGWAAIMKGLLRILWPSFALSWMKKVEKQKWLKIALPVSLALGIYLLYVAFSS